MAQNNVDFDVVRDIARALPGIEESTIHGAPSLKLRGKLFACPALHRSAEPNSLAVRINVDERAELIASEPSIYYVTDHYVKYAMVLVRLAAIDADALETLLVKACRYGDSARKVKKTGKC